MLASRWKAGTWDFRQQTLSPSVPPRLCHFSIITGCESPRCPGGWQVGSHGSSPRPMTDRTWSINAPAPLSPQMSRRDPHYLPEPPSRPGTSPVAHSGNWLDGAPPMTPFPSLLLAEITSKINYRQKPNQGSMVRQLA